MVQEWCLMSGIVLRNSLLKEKSVQVKIGEVHNEVDQMVACTEDCFRTMFITHSPGTFTKPNMDYYVISSLMKAFRNILTILNTKPKFQVLRDNAHFVPIMSWLQQSIMPQLVIGTKNDRVRYDWSVVYRLILLLVSSILNRYGLFLSSVAR